MRFKSYAIKFPVNLSKKIKDKGIPINLLLVSVYFLKVKKVFWVMYLRIYFMRYNPVIGEFRIVV